jgi:MFS transporter, DHA1 family, tetracycline resistance protein
MITDPVLQKRARRFILLTVFIYSVGFGIIMPVLPDLIRELTNVSLSEATRIGAWIGAAYGIFQFLLGPLVGNLGDRFGRRPVFLVSLFGFGADFLLMGLAPSIIWLFIGRSIAGGFGAIFGPANAAMADMSAAEDRAASFGKVGAAFGFGFIMGPALGGLLAEYGTRLPFFVAGGLAFANGIYGYFVFPETMDAGQRRPFEWRRANPLGALASLGKIKGILPVAFVYFIWVCSINIYPASWAFFARAQFGWDSKMTGVSLTLVGVSMVVFQTFIIGRTWDGADRDGLRYRQLSICRIPDQWHGRLAAQLFQWIFRYGDASGQRHDVGEDSARPAGRIARPDGQHVGTGIFVGAAWV